jgi:hypothetical protein
MLQAECLVVCLVEWAEWVEWVEWECKNSVTQNNFKTPEKSTSLAFFFILFTKKFTKN